MFPQHIIDALKEYKERLSDKIEDPRFLIWGSYAKGKQHEYSDLDVVVVSESFAKMDKYQRERLLFKRCLGIEVDIDPWGMTAKELEESVNASLMGVARDTGVFVQI